jgi:hypothetical protein
MPTLEEQYRLGADPTWRARCQSAGIQAATNVLAEDGATNGHAERAAFANKVMLQPSLQSQAMAFGVAAQPGITGAEATDSDILFTTNSLWDAWSGVGVT